MSEPTKAAMRAADKIWDEASDYDWNRRPPDVRVFETIIDRETGLPELVAALKLIRDEAKRSGDAVAAKWISDIADNALRKAGEL